MIRTENACLGKISYDTAEQANSSVANINKGCKKKRMVSYKCPHCAKFHNGHQNKGKTMKHDQKMKPINYVHIPGIHKLEEDE